MDSSTAINLLVDKYFDQIEVVNTDFYVTFNYGPDAAYLSLNIPTAMLKEYLTLKGQERELPDEVQFWKETRLVERLAHSNKYHGQGREPLEDILEFLGDEVCGSYQRINSSERIRLIIVEATESYEG